MDNRSNILLCALKLFSTHGYEAVGVQEIVNSAGITKPTLYHYFGSKKGLLESLIKEYYSLLYDNLSDSLIYKNDIRHTLNQITLNYFCFVKKYPEFYRLYLSISFAPLESESNQVIKDFLTDYYSKLENIFIEAANDHGNMKGRHQAYAVTFMGMLNAYMSLSLNNYLELDDKLAYQAVQQFMYGIYS